MTTDREVPARPANEVLAEAVSYVDILASVIVQRAAGPRVRTMQIQPVRDLAAQLRAMAAGPLAEDYEAALEWMAGNYGRYTIPEMLAGVRNRALELARERDAIAAAKGGETPC